MLRFNFKRFDDGGYLLSNDAGKYIFVDQDEFMQCASREIVSVPLYKRLEESLFIDSAESRVATAEALQKKISKGGVGAIRIIIQITNYCTCNCVYCLADSSVDQMQKSMTRETIEKTVDFIVRSGKNVIVVEFQGGEPLSQFESIKYFNELLQDKRRDSQEIHLSIMSNMTLLTEEMSLYLKNNHIGIGSSLDGPKEIHDRHRPLANGEGSFDLQSNRIKMHGQKVGTLFTITKDVLDKPREIIDYYLSQGQYEIFIRFVYNIGRAHKNWDTVGYSGKEFVEFYKQCVEYLFELNDQGIDVYERDTAESLAKVFNGRGYSIENTSPCGMLHEMLTIGWDGSIYSCDGGRMLADMGNKKFKVGTVYEDTYKSILYSEEAKELFCSSLVESKPSCVYCVYEPWCGKCAVEEAMYPHQANTYLCEINRGKFDYLFQCIKDERKYKYLRRWVDKYLRRDDACTT